MNDEGEIVWELNFPNTEDYRHKIHRMERFRWAPILSSPPDIWVRSKDNVSVTWQTWYNFRAKKHVKGSYTLYLDDVLIESGSHIFDKFWRPTNLTFDLEQLEVDNYNLTLVVADEAGHETIDSIYISPTTTKARTFNAGILIYTLELLCLVTTIRIWRKNR